MEKVLEKVLKTARFVVKRASLVKINKEKIKNLAKIWKKKKWKPQKWNYKIHFFDGTENSAQFILILDSLNFCFWPKEWKVNFEGKWYSGYEALAASLKRAVKKGYPLFDAKYLEKISLSDLQKIFEGKGEIPLIERRQKILREVGKVLQKNFEGKFSNLIKKAKKDAQRLVWLLIKNFPSFKDERKYLSKKIYFLKRAQILVADLHLSFSGKSWGEFFNIQKLTAFSDYKLPQVLHHFGILNYKKELLEKILQKKLIKEGSKEEVEIRAATIVAVEILKKALKKEGLKFFSFEIDNVLWNLSQKLKLKYPHHLTLTQCY